MAEEMTPAPEASAKFWRSSGSSTPALHFPEYIRILSSNYPKDTFKPERGARPLPSWAKELLLGPSSTTAKPSAKAANRGKLVEILCHVDRMYVRIRREVFKTRDAYKNLKLGTCPVNQGTKDHYYFLYLLKTDCGFNKQVCKSAQMSFFFQKQLCLFHCEKLRSSELFISRVMQITCPSVIRSTTSQPL